MQTHRSARAAHTERAGLSPWVSVVGLSLALALAVVVSVAQLTGHQPAHPAETTAVASTRQAVPAQRVVRGAIPSPVVYLTATQEQAAHTLQLSAEINALRVELGQPQVSVSVLVAGTERTLALDGLPSAPGTRLFDLRGP